VINYVGFTQQKKWKIIIYMPLRYLVWVFIVLLFNIAEFIHFHIQLWYTLPIL